MSQWSLGLKAKPGEADQRLAPMTPRGKTEDRSGLSKGAEGKTEGDQQNHLLETKGRTEDGAEPSRKQGETRETRVTDKTVHWKPRKTEDGAEPSGQT